MGVQTINVISQLTASQLDVHPQFFVTPDGPLQENGVKFSPSFMHTKTPPAPGSSLSVVASEPMACQCDDDLTAVSWEWNRCVTLVT